MLDKTETYKQLDELWLDQAVKALPTKEAKYVILSDLHMGNGRSADDFVRNESALVRALNHYKENGFTLILLGDVEELWQFDIWHITKRYDDSVYQTIREFGDERVIRVFGNHDHDWSGLEDPTKTGNGGFKYADEAIKLKDQSGEVRILLVHGHQGSVDSDKWAWFSRFFVRGFSYIEPFAKAIGLYRPKSATKSPVATDYERIMYTWAKVNKVLFMCGHSHRAIFASQSYGEILLDSIAHLKARRGRTVESRKTIQREIDLLERLYEEEKDKGRVIDALETDDDPLPCYFNSGCGIYENGITAIEINNDLIKLVKWDLDPDSEPEDYGSGSISRFIDTIDA